MAARKSQIANVRLVRINGAPVLEVTVPRGTTPNQTGALNEVLTNRVIPGLTGCAGCYSGLDFRITEEEPAGAFRVDLQGGEVLGAP